MGTQRLWRLRIALIYTGMGAEDGGDGFEGGVVGVATGAENLTVGFSEKEEDEATRVE